MKSDDSLPQLPAKPVTKVLYLSDFSDFLLCSMKCFELLIPRVGVLRKYGIKVIVNNLQAHV